MIYFTQTDANEYNQRCSEIDTRFHEQTNAAPRWIHDLYKTNHNSLGTTHYP